MLAFVVVATKGRAAETRVLLDYLLRQTLLPTFTVVVGTEARDVDGLDTHPLIISGKGEICVSANPGCSPQRNFGLEFLKLRGFFDGDSKSYFCSFFDDDFRPDEKWLQNAAERFEKGDIIGLTGRVLADGVTTGSLTEDQATAFLNKKIDSVPHWANSPAEHDVDCAYGCNMAFLGDAAKVIRFDENLPLYAWQEDRDYTGQCLKVGRVVHSPNCLGVHLGVSGGRTSGLRFGYSQIANPIYLMKKGTMSILSGIQHMSKNLLANILKGIFLRQEKIDYKGRLLGNFKALLDFLQGKSDPRRILDPSFETRK